MISSSKREIQTTNQKNEHAIGYETLDNETMAETPKTERKTKTHAVETINEVMAQVSKANMKTTTQTSNINNETFTAQTYKAEIETKAQTSKANTKTTTQIYKTNSETMSETSKANTKTEAQTSNINNETVTAQTKQTNSKAEARTSKRNNKITAQTSKINSQNTAVISNTGSKKAAQTSKMNNQTTALTSKSDKTKEAKVQQSNTPGLIQKLNGNNCTNTKGSIEKAKATETSRATMVVTFQQGKTNMLSTFYENQVWEKHNSKDCLIKICLFFQDDSKTWTWKSELVPEDCPSICCLQISFSTPPQDIDIKVLQDGKPV